MGADVDLDSQDNAASPVKKSLDGLQYAQKIFELTEGLIRRNYSQRSS